MSQAVVIAVGARETASEFILSPEAPKIVTALLKAFERDVKPRLLANQADDRW